MSKWTSKLPRIARRGMAVAIASALVLCAPAQTSFAKSAKPTKPILNVKKKTLYCNKSGKKTYTLKVKKNKVKMIVATTWKTSKKSVVALSKKKNSSVKLTAKKKGTATITATVKYIPKGKWAVKTAKLTCKVTSKQDGKVEFTSSPSPSPSPTPQQTQTPGTGVTKAPEKTAEPVQTPGNTATVAPEETPETQDTPGPDQTPGPTQTLSPTEMPQPGQTASPTETPEPEKTERPTEAPGADETADPENTKKPDETEQPVVAAVVLSPPEALLGLSEGRNSVMVTATVTDKDGEEVKNSLVIWNSDDEEIAKVDENGVVTAVSGGTANITAAVDGVVSEPCVITVDGEAPLVQNAVVADYKTITVNFSEAVTGTPVVYVKSGDQLIEQTAALSEDGETMTLTSEEALATGTYDIVISGLSDMAGNELKDASVSVEKETSVVGKFVCKTDRIPAGQSSFDIFFAVCDQYGQEFEEFPKLSEGELTVSAATENGMPLKAEVKGEVSQITVTGPSSAFVKDRTIKVTLTYAVQGTEVCASVMDILVVDAANKGKPVKFGGLSVSSEKMEKTDTPEGPSFALNGKAEDDIFNVCAKFFDEFGYDAVPSDVIYMIDDESVISFVDSTPPNSATINTSNSGVAVRALKGGTAKISAYLAEDDSLWGEITVTIRSTKLREIKVDRIDEGINGRPSEAKIILNPAGSGITADQLKCKALSPESEARVKSLSLIPGEDGIYVNITGKTDGKDDPIEFVVYYDNGTEDESDDVVSNTVTYISSPLLTPASIEIDGFEEKAVTAGDSASTAYRIRNRYEEDITKRDIPQPVCQIKNSTIVSSAVVGTGKNAGILTVQGESKGMTDIDLYMAANPTISSTISVKVEDRAYVNEIRFDKLSEEKNGLPFGDREAIVYIPVKVYNQYAKEYTSLTKTVADDELTFTINGDDYDAAESDILIRWYKKDGDRYQAAVSENAAIDTLGICWNDKESYMAASGDTIRIGVRSKKNRDTFINNTADNQFVIPVKPERRISRLEFADTCKAAVAGAQVANTITVKDQYGKACELSDGQQIVVEIADGDNSQVLNGSVQTEGGSTKCVIDTGSYPNEYGIYTVQAYVTGDNAPSGVSRIEGSFTLIVDSAQSLIEKIEIVDQAQIKGSDVSVPLTGQCVKITGSSTLRFDCKAYTAYNGKEAEVSLKDKEGNLISSLQNGLIWQMSGTEGATVEQVPEKTFGEWTIRMAAGKQANVTVSLDYLPKKKSAIKTFLVSSEEPKPQGKHQIINGERGGQNLIGANFKAEKNPAGYTFAVMDVDQYGEAYEGTDLWAVISDDDDAIAITLGGNEDLGVNEFHIALGERARIGQIYTITVYVTKDVSYSFTVTVEPTAVTGVGIEPSELVLEVGKTAKLNAVVLPEYATNRKISWTAIAEGDQVVVTVKDGVVTAVSEGTATITATTEDGGKTASCTVTVNAAEGIPTGGPTATPTVEPSTEPTSEPTATPTVEPTAEPTSEPTAEPTSEPTAEPTSELSTEPLISCYTVTRNGDKGSRITLPVMLSEKIFHTTKSPMS